MTAANREAGPAPPRDPLRDRPPRRQLHREATPWLARKPCCGASPNAANDRYGGHCCAAAQRAEAAALFRRAIEVRAHDDDTWSWEMAARMLGAVVGDPRVETRRPVPVALRELCRQRLIEIRRALAERPEGAPTYRWSFRPPRIDDRRITERDWAEVDYLFSEEDRWSHLRLTGEDLGGCKPSKLPPNGGQYPGPGDLLLKLSPCGGISVKTRIPKDWPHRWPVAAGSAQGKTWYVNASAKDAYSDGSYLHPFWDLRAFAKLDAYGKPLLQAGDRVIFAQGTYWVGPSANPALGKKADTGENIAVWLPHGNEEHTSVTFEAAPCAHVVLHVLPKTPNYAGYGLVFASPEKWPGDALGVKPAQIDLVLTNLHFAGSAFATDSDQFAANRCENMVLFRAAGVYLQGCTFRGGGDTLKDAVTTNLVTSETTVEPGKNFVSGNLYGTVQIADADHGVVIDCVFDGRLRTVPLKPGGSEPNSHIVPDEYLKVWRSQDIVFERCVVMNGGHFGMYVLNSERIAIRQCWFRNRLHTCLEFQQSKDCVVERCLFAGCGAATEVNKSSTPKSNLIQWQAGGTGHRIRFNVLHGDAGAATTGYLQDSALGFVTDKVPHPFPSPSLLPKLTDYSERTQTGGDVKWTIGGKEYSTKGTEPVWQVLAAKYVPRCLKRSTWEQWHKVWFDMVKATTTQSGSVYNTIPGFADSLPIGVLKPGETWTFKASDPSQWPAEYQESLAALPKSTCMGDPAEGPFGCGQSKGPWPISAWCNGKVASGDVCKDGGEPARCPDGYVRVFVRQDAIDAKLKLSPFDYLKNYTVTKVDNGPGKEPTRVSTGYQAPPILPGSLVWPDTTAPETALHSDFAPMLYADCQVYNNLILDIGERALQMGSQTKGTPMDLQSLYWNNWIGNNIIYGQRSDPTRNFEKWFGFCGGQNSDLPVVANVQVQDSDLGGAPLVDLSFPGFYDGSSGNRFVDNVIGRRPDDVLHVWVPTNVEAWLKLAKISVLAKAGQFTYGYQFQSWKVEKFAELEKAAKGYEAKKKWWAGSPLTKGFESKVPECIHVPYQCQDKNKPCLFYTQGLLRHNSQVYFAAVANSENLKTWLNSDVTLGGPGKSEFGYMAPQPLSALEVYEKVGLLATAWGFGPPWLQAMTVGAVDEPDAPMANGKLAYSAAVVAHTDWTVRLPRVVNSAQVAWTWSWAGQLNKTLKVGAGNTSAIGLAAILGQSGQLALGAGKSSLGPSNTANQQAGPWWPPDAMQPNAELSASESPSDVKATGLDFFGLPINLDAPFRGPFDLAAVPAETATTIDQNFPWAPGG